MEKNWYALYTSPNHEFKVEKELESQGVSRYLPKLKKTRQWSDRKKVVEIPLIPGYVFIYATERERLDAHSIKAVLKTVTFNGKPAVIPDWQIDNLKILLAGSDDVQVTDKFKKGEKIRVKEGPLKNLEGEVIQIENNHHLGISIDALKMCVIIKISPDLVTRID